MELVNGAFVFALCLLVSATGQQNASAQPGNESRAVSKASSADVAEPVAITEEKAIEMDAGAKEQLARLLAMEKLCGEMIINATSSGALAPSLGTVSHCPIVWDGALCWPQTEPGRIQKQNCPTYVHGFNHSAHATRSCTEAGTWRVSHSTNESWTNYTQCKPQLATPYGNHNSLFEAHIDNIQLVTKIGYSVSLVTLLVAFVILTFNKRLRCPRNNLHLQLFLSFIIRSFVFHVKSSFFTYGSDSGSAGHEQSAAFNQSEALLTNAHYTYSGSDETRFDAHFAFVERTDALPCKVFTIVWQYSLLANYNWILMEGMYLHNLIFLHIFNDNSSILKYIIVGWGLPLVFIIPWTAVRALYEDRLCWTTNQNPYYFWIIRGPITVSIILNFVFFINITRVLFLKMFAPASAQMNRGYNYSKWFKSTLVLVPLFGVHYAFLLLFNSLSLISRDMEIVWLYVDLLFTSFQGFFVALLYCFLNGEVQQELRKWWRNHFSSGSSQPPSHSTTYHSILAHSLTYLGRGRNSVLSTGEGRKDTKSSRSPSPNASKKDSMSQITSTFNTKELSSHLIEPSRVNTGGSSESIL